MQEMLEGYESLYFKIFLFFIKDLLMMNFFEVVYVFRLYYFQGKNKSYQLIYLLGS